MHSIFEMVGFVKGQVMNGCNSKTEAVRHSMLRFANDALQLGDGVFRRKQSANATSGNLETFEFAFGAGRKPLSSMKSFRKQTIIL